MLPNPEAAADWLVWQVVYDVAGAIKAAEAHGILHRDITPGNFGLVNRRGWLMDFSAAIVSLATFGGMRGGWHSPTPGLQPGEGIGTNTRGAVVAMPVAGFGVECDKVLHVEVLRESAGKGDRVLGQAWTVHCYRVRS